MYMMQVSISKFLRRIVSFYSHESYPKMPDLNKTNEDVSLRASARMMKLISEIGARITYGVVGTSNHTD